MVRPRRFRPGRGPTSSNAASDYVSTPSVPLLGPSSSTSSCCPDFERPDRIGEFCGDPQSRALAELLIDCEEDRTLRAMPVSMQREAD